MRDLIDSNCQFISLENLKEIYKFNPNILEYYRVKALVKTFVETNKIGQFFSLFTASFPTPHAVLVKSKQRM